MYYKEQLNAADGLCHKYRNAPRTGWVDKNSRAKSNHAITVSRNEVIKLATDYKIAVLGLEINYYEIANLIHFMEQLANSDVKKCPKCFNTYSDDWLKDKCPYCEAWNAAKSMIS